MDDLHAIYERKYPGLRRAKERLWSILKEVIAAIEDKTLVRVEIHSVRIKELPSLQRKAEKNGWGANEALWRCSDLIGARVVCNNIEDVYRFAELLKERLASPWNNFSVQDYIREPKEGGYRSLHVNFDFDLGEHLLERDLVSCEVQIQSRLQDAWAVLTHDDIYKQPALPEDLRARAKDIAEVLAAADKIASDIRSRAMREIPSPAHPPDMRQVSVEGLVYSFKDVFGRSPHDYVVRLALNLCDRLHITTLEEFPNVSRGQNFVTKSWKPTDRSLGWVWGMKMSFSRHYTRLRKVTTRQSGGPKRKHVTSGVRSNSSRCAKCLARYQIRSEISSRS